MKLLVLLTILLMGLMGSASSAWADPSPVDPRQPRDDIFDSGIAAHPKLDYYSTLDNKVRETGVIFWNYKVYPGCADGNISQNIGRAMGDLYDNTNLVSVWTGDKPNLKPDLTITVYCGAAASAAGVDGGVVGCLCTNYPYNNDIALSNVMKDWPVETQVSIVCHEYCGHALSVWDEQYCKAAGLPPGCAARFSSVPDWNDIMNTGPSSRHFWGTVEANRWGRTHGSGAPAAFGLGPGYLWMCGISDKALGVFVWDYGVVMFDQLKAAGQGRDGCFGIAVDTSKQVCFTLGNMVDWKRPEYRSDRCVNAAV